MRIRIVFCILLLLLVVAGCGKGRKESSSPSPMDTPASTAIHCDDYGPCGTLYPTETPSLYGLIIVSDNGNNPEKWDPVIHKAVSTGISCAVAYTLKKRADGDNAQTTSSHHVPNVLMEPVDAARRALVERGVQPQNIVILAESAVCASVMCYVLGREEIAGIVLVSPSLKTETIDLCEKMREYGNRPCLLMAAEGDAYATASAQTLKKNAQGFCELRIYAGGAHGADLFHSSKQATEQVLLWISQILNFQLP